ncbi:MAG TPA: aspartate-semialdehyde dehydrogenase [Candidatus Nanoarchaeia archaeon]|nr:aspartate-semialdehyde dehydrogenase [Candidatus Nanoarchaeia archaeon]
MAKIKVGILGATGTVGQRFIQLLENHPWFQITEVAASENSAGKTYEEAVKGRWMQHTPIPSRIRNLKVKECKPNLNCSVIFSGLDAAVAGEIEAAFADKGYKVFSNAKNHRMDAHVPLMIPEVNGDHAKLIKTQKRKGFIVTNPNCTTIGMVMALAPLHKEYGVKSVIMTSMQAISGAGYPGVASMDIVDNVIPYIGGEEEKVQIETLKLLGTIEAGKVKPANIAVSAHCNRVAVIDGHTETISFSLHKNPTIDEIKRTLSNYNPLGKLKLPSAPVQPIIVMDEQNRPQPKLDRNLEKGMACVVGRIRKDDVLGYKMVVLSHNTIRGAAGCSILNAELMKAKGFLEE